jgi:hypothetical protein
MPSPGISVTLCVMGPQSTARFGGILYSETAQDALENRAAQVPPARI